jgi:hypothetical protein
VVAYPAIPAIQWEEMVGIMVQEQLGQKVKWDPHLNK